MQHNSIIGRSATATTKQTLTGARQCARSCVNMRVAVRPCSADGAL